MNDIYIETFSIIGKQIKIAVMFYAENDAFTGSAK